MLFMNICGCVLLVFIGEICAGIVINPTETDKHSRDKRDDVQTKLLKDEVLDKSASHHYPVHTGYYGDRRQGVGYDNAEGHFGEYPTHDVPHHPVHGPYLGGGHHLEHYGGGYGHFDGYLYGKSLALKSILIPLAGVALLGAAATLISNPVLLQLGVIAGKRRRRRRSIVTNDEFQAYRKHF